MLHGQHNFPNQHFHLPSLTNMTTFPLKTLVVLQTILDDFSKSFHPKKPFIKEDGCQEMAFWISLRAKTFIIIKI